jgi:hypothetical protein
MRTKLLASLLFTGLASPWASAAINWKTGTGVVLTGSDGTTPLAASRDDAVGCFIQLLWAGPNGVIDPAAGGNGANGAGGDDVVIDVAWLGIGLSATPPQGVLAVQPEAGTSPVNLQPGQVIFARAWNSPWSGAQAGTTSAQQLAVGDGSESSAIISANSGLRYGDSQTLTLPGDYSSESSATFDIHAFSTTKVPSGPPNLTLATSSGQDVIAQPVVTFPHTLVGSGNTVSFVVGNTGVGALTLTGVQAFGDFSVTTPPTGTVNPGTPSPLVITFSPTAGGFRNGVLQILSNDTSNGNLLVTLTGRGFVATADDDADTVPNSAEFGLAAFGFDPLVNDAGRVTTLRDNGFYQSGDIGNLALGRPLLHRDPGTGSFRLKLGFQKSPDLTGWSPLLGYSLSQDIPSGTLQLEFSSGGPSPQFYRVWGEPAAP